MTTPEPSWAERILSLLQQAPHGRAGYKQMVRELGARGPERDRVADVLDELAKQGRLIELRGQQYVLPESASDYAVGRLQMHRDGYGFVQCPTPPAGLRGDLFLPPGAVGHAMHGDRVLARIRRIAADGRAEGELVKILERAHPTVVGEFRVGRRGCYVIPHENRIQQHIEIPEGLELPGSKTNPDRIGAAVVHFGSVEELDGLIVHVEILDYPERGDDTAVGRVIEVLGHPDDFGVDVETTIRKHHLPHRFPAEVLEQAQGFNAVIRSEELAGRRDFRHLPVVTIDGETARDFDDAVWVDQLEDGHFLLHVHIADVSHYVRPDTPIDREALLRGTSVYFPDRAVPMLPLELSTGICSLLPGVDRLVMSALLEIGRQGDIVRQEFCRGVIRSAERMTYTNVHLLLEGDEPALRERYASLLPRFELMRTLALILNQKRVRRGSIDFDLPEPQIVFDEAGAMTGIARAPRNIAHRIIEEFMLAANEAVSAHLEAHCPESIFRIHEKPDPARVLEFEETAARFGYALGLAAVPVKRYPFVDKKRDGRRIRRDLTRPDESFEITSRMYQKLVAKLEGRPEERILSYLMLRSLKQARYSTSNSGHFALAAKTYTHFTSPIRRYPDLVVHRLLGALLDGAEPRISSLSAIAGLCSETERRAAEAERELLEWKKIRFMAERVGEEFSALVISVTRFGFFVELDELFVEGLVPIDFLPGERWDFQENSRKIVAARSKKTISIGDAVRVRLARVDAVERRLHFALVLPQEAGKRASRRR